MVAEDEASPRPVLELIHDFHDFQALLGSVLLLGVQLGDRVQGYPGWHPPVLLPEVLDVTPHGLPSHISVESIGALGDAVGILEELQAALVMSKPPLLEHGLGQLLAEEDARH